MKRLNWKPEPRNDGAMFFHVPGIPQQVFYITIITMSDRTVRARIRVWDEIVEIDKGELNPMDNFTRQCQRIARRLYNTQKTNHPINRMGE
jgi:hypothetical protein